MDLNECFYDLKQALEPVYDAQEAAAIAHELLFFLTGKDKMQRMMDKQQLLSEQEKQSYLKYKKELLSGRPLQYVTGESWFLGRLFRVNEHVLIPRPETEELVQWVKAEHAGKELLVLDVGTGSGCIAVSLALEMQGISIEACDISEEALLVAKKNASRLEANVQFFRTDILSSKNWLMLPQYDIIVSNPPYIPEEEKVNMHINVANFEPVLALFTPEDDPLLFYRAIADLGRKHLKPGGKIYCELHKDHALLTANLFIEKRYNTLVKNDMHGNARMLRAILQP